MRLTPARAFQILRSLGAGWAVYRLKHAVEIRSGHLRRKLPIQEWTERPLASFLATPALADPQRYADYRHTGAPSFFFSPYARNQAADTLLAWDEGTNEVVQQAEKHLTGIFTYFSRHENSLGVPPHWMRNPFTGQEVPANRHWSVISDFGHGDIKLIWELSRFSFVYDLVRAYWRSGDDRYPAFFWQMVEDWHMHNPPQQGPNWKCGQETSFRVMAWIFGLYGFLGNAAATPERLVMLAQMIALSGERVAGHLDYALSQRNNHGISEGMGLWTIGLLFPELKQAHAWRERGRQVLESLAQDLIYPDGAFVQHSVNYHRLMLHDYLWSIRLGEICSQPLSAELRSRVARAVDFLYQIQDDASGRLPLYGQNDGALILPLSNCDYLDFRPVVQVGHFLCYGSRCYEPGPWDEDVYWFFGAGALDGPVVNKTRNDFSAPDGGYYTLRSKHGFAMIRCASYRDRPGQADMLHFDLWQDGVNIATDAGTYSYNAPAPWDNALAGSEFHNTVTVDHQDQMDRVGKFLWLPWLRSSLQVNKRSPANFFAYLEGFHDGYTALDDPVLHRRGILRIGDECWLVVDRLIGQELHTYRLHWLLADLPYLWQEERHCLRLNTNSAPIALTVEVLGGHAQATLVRGQEDTPRGWQSSHYMDRQPALSFAVEVEARQCWFWSLFGPPSATLKIGQEGVSVHYEKIVIQVETIHGTDSGLLRYVQASGAVQDQLTIL